MMRIVLISDTHGLHHRMPHLPDGDLLIHAGDCTNRGADQEVAEFLEWFARLAELPRVRLHVFGHIHEAYGREERHGRDYVNASICDVRYRPVNLPVAVDYPGS